MRLARLVASRGPRGALMHLQQGARRRLASKAIPAAPRSHIGTTTQFIGLSRITIGEGLHVGERNLIEAVEHHQGRSHTPTLTIGRRVSMRDDVHIACADHVTIGDDVLMGARILVTDHGHGTYSGASQSSPHTAPNERPLGCAPVTIGPRVWIGDGVVVLPGTTVGAGSILGANAVVHGEIPAGSMVVGNPGRIVKTWDDAQQAWIRTAAN